MSGSFLEDCSLKVVSSQQKTKTVILNLFKAADSGKSLLILYNKLPLSHEICKISIIATLALTLTTTPMWGPNFAST